MVKGYDLYLIDYIVCIIDYWKNICIKKFMKNNFIVVLKLIKFDI